MMTTLPSCESAGVVGSMDGYTSVCTFFVNCIDVIKWSRGRLEKSMAR
jgi:hypothetical protein